jgi:hypothetical protein
MATPKRESQIEKFKQAARDLEADESESRFDERLAKIARQKPPPEKPSRKERNR